jgi:hypothetical protein
MEDLQHPEELLLLLQLAGWLLQFWVKRNQPFSQQPVLQVTMNYCVPKKLDTADANTAWAKQLVQPNNFSLTEHGRTVLVVANLTEVILFVSLQQPAPRSLACVHLEQWEGCHEVQVSNNTFTAQNLHRALKVVLAKRDESVNSLHAGNTQ